VEAASSAKYECQESTNSLRQNNSGTRISTSKTLVSDKDFGMLIAERAHTLSAELLEERIYHKPNVTASKINSINYHTDIFYIALVSALLAGTIHNNARNIVHGAVSLVITKNDIYITRYNDFKDIDETIDTVTDDYQNMLDRITMAMKAESPMFALNGVFRDEVIKDTELFYDLGGIEFIDFISTCMEDAVIIAKKYQIKEQIGKGEFSACTHTNTSPSESNSAIKSSVANKKIREWNLVLFSNITAIILSSVSILDIILALNLQDEDRNYYEHWNTTTVYFILISLFCIFLLFSILSLKKRIFKILHPISYSLIIATIIVIVEKSVFSHGYYRNNFPRPYSNNDLIDIFNAIWIIGVILIFIITLLPGLIKVAKSITERRYKSIGYREKCYRRVAKIHRYLESGIITEEEYTSAKNDIMKNIK
jgi:uncharacterized membrane protein